MQYLQAGGIAEFGAYCVAMLLGMRFASSDALAES